MRNELLVLACAVMLGIGGMFVTSTYGGGDDGVRTTGAVGTYQAVLGGPRNVSAP